MEEQKKFETLPVESPAHIPVLTSESLFFNTARFELAQRVANVFATSNMVPQQFQGNIGNCVIALNLAERMKCEPFMLMQNMYIVHGRPGIEAKLAIALVNNTGKFSPLQYQYNEKKTACYAHAKRTGTGEECQGVTVSLQMAQAEGWMSKKGSKWQTMPELMLMYRSAMFFVRAYCPEALLGMQSREELYDAGTVDMVSNGAGSFAPEPSTQDLADKILNGGDSKPENGKHGAGLSDADRDMGKAQDTKGIENPPPPKHETPAFTTEETDTTTDAQEDADEDKKALSSMSKALFDNGIVLPNKEKLLDFLKATGKDYDFPLIEVVEMAQKNLQGFVNAYGKWEKPETKKAENGNSEAQPEDNDAKIRESAIYNGYEPTKEDIQKRYNAEKTLKIRDTIKELEIEASPNFLNGATGAVLHEFLLNNLKDDEPDPLPDQEPPETQQGGVDYDLTQTDEWQELTLLSESHRAEYKAVMAGRAINNVEDLKAAISEIDTLVDSQSSPFGAGIPDGK